MPGEVTSAGTRRFGADVALLSGAAAAVLRLLGSTWRLRLVGEEHLLAARASSEHLIFSVWHGRLLPAAFLHRNHPLCILVSRHRDGEIITRILRNLGFGVARGSTRRGGAEAFLALLSESRHTDVAITPDGPRGPSRRLAPGVLRLAQRSGLPILPVGCRASAAWRTRSWDRFLIPKPFARVTVTVGEAIHVPADADEDAADRIGESLRRAMDVACGLGDADGAEE